MGEGWRGMGLVQRDEAFWLGIAARAGAARPETAVPMPHPAVARQPAVNIAYAGGKTSCGGGAFRASRG